MEEGEHRPVGGVVHLPMVEEVEALVVVVEVVGDRTVEVAEVGVLGRLA